MIGIEGIGVYIPPTRVDNLSKMSEFEIDENFLHTKTGMLRLAVKDEDYETSDLCCRAFEDLKQKSNIDIDEIDCIVVCTQNPDKSGLPHTSAIVHSKLGLPTSCATFDISLGCSGYVYSLSIIKGFMESNGFKKGLLFTADPYSKIVDKSDKNTSLLFGDAATVTLIGDDPSWTFGKFLFGSNGAEHAAIKVDTQTGNLQMNGRSVFSFTASMIPGHIKEMLSKNDVNIEDVDYFALHQGSRYIVDTLQKRLGVPEEKVPFVAADYGNTVSSSIPLIISGLKQSKIKVVISGFGVGLSWASSVLYKER